VVVVVENTSFIYHSLLKVFHLSSITWNLFQTIFPVTAFRLPIDCLRLQFRLSCLSMWPSSSHVCVCMCMYDVCVCVERCYYSHLFYCVSFRMQQVYRDVTCRCYQYIFIWLIFHCIETYGSIESSCHLCSVIVSWTSMSCCRALYQTLYAGTVCNSLSTACWSICTPGGITCRGNFLFMQ